MSSTHQTAEEARAEQVQVMGEQLGTLYHALWQEVVWLHAKWGEFVSLFGTKPSRIELLNKAAPGFFRIVQDMMWEDILLHIARLTDPPRTGGKTNLSIQSLSESVGNPATRNSVEGLAAKALTASDFCRDWRNRRIAHRDLALALEHGAKPLKEGSRRKAREAIDAISAVLNAVSDHYQGSTTAFQFSEARGGAMSLLYVLDDGVKAELARRERRKSGHYDPGDSGPRNL